MFIALLVCFQWHVFMQGKRGQLASGLPFQMNTQHANVQEKLAIVACHLHKSTTQQVSRSSIKCRDRKEEVEGH